MEKTDMKRNRKAKEMLTIFWKACGVRSSSSSYIGRTHIWIITLNMSALKKGVKGRGNRAGRTISVCALYKSSGRDWPWGDGPEEGRRARPQTRAGGGGQARAPEESDRPGGEAEKAGVVLRHIVDLAEKVQQEEEEVAIDGHRQ